MVRIRAWEGGDESSASTVCGRAALIGRSQAPARAVEAPAQYTYRCVGKDGKKYYGQTVPQQCLGRPRRADQPAGPGGEAHRPRGRREGERRQGSRGREEARARRRDQGRAAPQPRAARHLHAARRKSRTRARATCRTTQGRCSEIEKRIDEHQETPAAVPEGARAVQAAARASRPTRLKEEIINAEIDLKAQEDAARREEEGSRSASTRATTRTSSATRKPSAASSRRSTPR